MNLKINENRDFYSLTDHFTQLLLEQKMKKGYHAPIIFVCIGTDRVTGDALGPLIGTSLAEFTNYLVFGTVEEPVHAKNIEDIQTYIQNHYKDPIVIAIDAMLGQSKSIGSIYIEDQPIKPGAGVGKDINPIGDISIAGVVNVGGMMNQLVLQSTRLHTVLTLSKQITKIIKSSIYKMEKELKEQEMRKVQFNVFSPSEPRKKPVDVQPKMANRLWDKKVVPITNNKR